MSSRLFQNVREKRGLAYSVFSGMSAYRDAGNMTIYAGCAADAVEEVIDLSVEELRGLKRTPVPDDELKRAKDHLKGSLMLSLENTASRMSHLARQEIYFDRHFSLDETLAGVQRVTAADIQRVARGPAVERIAGRDGARSEGAGLPPGAAWIWVSCLGASRDSELRRMLMIQRYTHPEMGAIWSEQRRYETWLEVELAATDAMADAGLVPAEAARELRARAAFDVAASRKSNARPSTTSSRSRLPSPRRSGRRRAGCTSASPRPTSSTPRRRCRCARPAASSSRTSPALMEAVRMARRGAPADADDRAHARRPRRADDVRRQAGAVVRGTAARPRSRPARARRRRRSASSPVPSARSRTSIRTSRRASASGSDSSRRRSRRR